MRDPLTSPGPTLGVVGGGQLGRMLAEAASPLGVELVVLDPTPDCPAATGSRDQIVGNFDDAKRIYELASRVDALTFEIELADPDVLEGAGEEYGIPVHPSPETLRTIQDKLVQKRHLQENGIPVPRFRAVSDADDVRAAMDEFGAPVMLKARRGGYDGRGNVPVERPDDAESALSAVTGGERQGPEAMVEAFVEFERELSVIGVKGDGEIATYVAGENVHEEEILRETVVPARASEAVRERAQSAAREVLELLEGRGTYGIELFETPDGDVLVNEIAPRPHNSGHWTIEGARVSQFEQHVRAVLGWPLGSTELRDPAVSANLLGDVEDSQPASLHGVEELLAAPDAHLHWYGKREARPLRKMGHLTVVSGGADDDRSREELLESARTYRDRTTFRTP